MQRIIRNFIAGLGERLDYAVIPKWRLENFPFAEHLREVFRNHQIDCVVDVGANTGGYGSFLRQQVGYEGLIVSIEPIPASFGELEKMARADGQWLPYRMAFGAETGAFDINVTKSAQLCSFLTPDASVLPRYEESGGVLRTERVPVQRFDEFLPRFRTEHAVKNLFLKLDTQGWDLEVVKGAGAALADVRALQSEVSMLPLYKGIADYTTAIEAIRSHGFDVSGMFPVNRDDNLRIIDFDCVMVRRPAA